MEVINKLRDKQTGRVHGLEGKCIVLKGRMARWDCLGSNGKYSNGGLYVLLRICGRLFLLYSSGEYQR